MEENVLAIIDAADSKDTRYSTDDRIAFLQAVRSTSIVPENGDRPTKKMYEAVFRMLRFSTSVELIVESYRLLIALEKRFPWVHVLDSSSELVVANESWSPFEFNIEIASNDKEGARLDLAGFHLLVQQIVEVDEANTRGLEAKALRNLFLLQYLVIILENDFVQRSTLYEETRNWSFLRESFLNMLVCSRQINYKVLMKDCLSILCRLHQMSIGLSTNKYPDEPMDMAPQNGNTVPVALIEQGSATCAAVQKLLTMIMELDISRKKADMRGCTTRADGIRTPLMEIILNELTYNGNMLSPFLQIFTEPRRKLDIILLYFSKYIPRPYVRTRRSEIAVAVTEDATLEEVLKWLSSMSNAKSIVKRLSSDVVQVLLAHSFQACLSVLSSEQNTESIIHPKDNLQESSLLEICKYIVPVFSNLQRLNEALELTDFGKQAIFTAATILSTT